MRRGQNAAAPVRRLLASLCLLAPAGFVVRPPSSTEDSEEIDAFILAREPLRRDQRTVDVPRQTGSGDEHPLLVNRPPAGGEERVRSLLAGGDEQQRRAVLVALPPAFELGVFAVVLGLPFELAG
ncbi:MAG TPA: hypothetical protein VHQ43_05570 [Solirubrobacterales bacterium]|nr:hypothetical protein [Solirubrobacterales bacterium]